MSDGLRNQSLSGLKWSAIERFAVQGIQFVNGSLIEVNGGYNYK